MRRSSAQLAACDRLAPSRADRPCRCAV